MAFENVLGELQKEEMIDANAILDSLLNPKNIDLKTHIVSPITFAVLEGIVNNLETLLSEVGKQKIKLPLTRKILKDIIYTLAVPRNVTAKRLKNRLTLFLSTFSSASKSITSETT